MKMKPMGDQLLLKAREQKENVVNGIILTTNTPEYGYADVIAVGPGLFTQTGDKIPMTCRVGDVVIAPSRLLSGKNGNEIVLEEEKYLLVRESEISMVSTD
jgi:co-chaperonin GroES (HSP10)|tara:strand:- start:9 stop:311 length:303 start_codon:yes stop_codon:yes gene_type:complete